MKITKSTFILIATSILGLAWLQAQEAAKDSDTPPVDKWTQVQTNNKEFSKSLEEIEKNLQFIKARSMSGGRS